MGAEVDTAVREYQRVSLLMPPGTMVSYMVSCMVSAKEVVDFDRGRDAPFAIVGVVLLRLA